MKELIKREFRLFFQDKTLLSVFLVAPIIYAFLIGSIYQSGKVQDLPIIVVDQDQTPLSTQLTDMLSENEKLRVHTLRNESPYPQEEMVRSKAVLAIVIPDRFEADILQKRHPEINVYINTTNLLTANLASGAAQLSIGSFNAGIELASLKKSTGVPMAQFEPFKTNYIRLFNPAGNYFTYMWPGMIMVVFQQVLLLGLAVSFAREFEDNTFHSTLLRHTKSPAKLILTKVLPFWIGSVLLVGLFYFFHKWFNAPMPYAIGPFAVNIAIFVAAVSMLGVALSLLFKNALRATQILMLIAAPAFIMGGYSWPIEAMPKWVQLLAHSIPLTPFLEAHKMMLFQKASFSSVLPQISTLLLQTVIYGVMAYGLLYFSVRKSGKSIHEESQHKAG